jgi:hypothetical protein
LTQGRTAVADAIPFFSETPMGKFVPSTKGIDYGKRLQTPQPTAAQPTEPTPTEPCCADPKPAAVKPSPHPHLDRVLAQTEPRQGPADYDPQFCIDVVEVMGEGFSLTAFAGAINASRKTLNAWVADHPAFAAAVERGRAARTRALETQFLTAGTGAKVAAHVFALKNAAPEDWRERPDAETAKGANATIVVIDNDRGDPPAHTSKGSDVG